MVEDLVRGEGDLLATGRVAPGRIGDRAEKGPAPINKEDLGHLLQMAAYDGRFCGAKRPRCGAERPGFPLI